VSTGRAKLEEIRRLIDCQWNISVAEAKWLLGEHDRLAAENAELRERVEELDTEYRDAVYVLEEIADRCAPLTRGMEQKVRAVVVKRARRALPTAGEAEARS